MPIIEILATLLLGLFLYVVRCRRQFAYGVFELRVAMTIVFLTLYPFRSYPHFGDFDLWEWIRERFSDAIAVMAGIYVMVRGLDNIEKGLSGRPRERWQQIFYGRKSPPA